MQKMCLSTKFPQQEIRSNYGILGSDILSERFFLKREGLYDARVASITKKIWFCSTFFTYIHKVFKVNI